MSHNGHVRSNLLILRNHAICHLLVSEKSICLGMKIVFLENFWCVFFTKNTGECSKDKTNKNENERHLISNAGAIIMNSVPRNRNWYNCHESWIRGQKQMDQWNKTLECRWGQHGMNFSTSWCFYGLVGACFIELSNLPCGVLWNVFMLQ